MDGWSKFFYSHFLWFGATSHPFTLADRVPPRVQAFSRSPGLVLVRSWSVLVEKRGLAVGGDQSDQDGSRGTTRSGEITSEKACEMQHVSLLGQWRIMSCAGELRVQDDPWAGRSQDARDKMNGKTC